MTSHELFVVCFLLELITLIGFYGYMYDRCWKWKPGWRADYGVASGIWLLVDFFVLPFRYLKFARKAKDGKAPVVFLAYWLLLATTIWLGCLATANARKMENKTHIPSPPSQAEPPEQS